MNNLLDGVDDENKKIGFLLCDGGSRGNPGIAGSGFVIFAEDKKELDSGGEFCGSDKTNNYAEYRSLILGLRSAKKLGITHLKVFMGSKLVIEQMSGCWKVKHEGIKVLFAEAKKVAEGFAMLKFQHIPREKNKIADAIANEFVDKGE